MEQIKNIYRIGSGPSSSHTMGPERCARYMIEKYENADAFDVVLYGSLALTGKGHLTDYILIKTFKNYKCDISYNFDINIPYPNYLEITAKKNNMIIAKEKFASIGGGSIINLDKREPNQENNPYPFKNFLQIKEYCLQNALSLADIVYKFEGEECKLYLQKVLLVMEKAIKRGINCQGELPGNLHLKRKAYDLYYGDVNVDLKIKLLTSYAYATSEENASGGIIVTAPTCGACGVLPAVLFYLKRIKNFDDQKLIDALAVASIIGNVIKSNACVSGALAGCQSEIGAACSMSAAAATYLLGGSVDEIECAAEIAMEHHLGLTCDPVNGYVQIPCIERNAIAALRALDASSLSFLVSPSRKISFDTVVQTMYETGLDLSKAYKETSLGGLAKNYYCK